MTMRRRSRAPSPPRRVLVLTLVGTGAAWAFWRVVTATSTVTGAAGSVAPVITASCSPKTNLANDPVTVSWPAVAPTGATAVVYRVTFVSETGVTRSFPSATTTTTATSVQVNSTQLGSSSAERELTQTITVQSFVTFPSVSWTAVSNIETAYGVTVVAWTDMHC